MGAWLPRRVGEWGWGCCLGAHRRGGPDCPSATVASLRWWRRAAHEGRCGRGRMGGVAPPLFEHIRTSVVLVGFVQWLSPLTPPLRLLLKSPNQMKVDRRVPRLYQKKTPNALGWRSFQENYLRTSNKKKRTKKNNFSIANIRIEKKVWERLFDRWRWFSLHKWLITQTGLRN